MLLRYGIIVCGEKVTPGADFVKAMTEVCITIMGFIIKLTPFGVFALITPVVANNGPSVLLPLIKLIGVMYLASFLHVIIVYSSCVKFIGRMNPITFFRGMSSAILFAFSSASSVGTFRLSFECSVKL